MPRGKHKILKMFSTRKCINLEAAKETLNPIVSRLLQYYSTTTATMIIDPATTSARQCS